MENREKYRPFTGDGEGQVRVKASAPLELVLCQVRWPELTKLQGDLRVVALKFGESLEAYPFFSEIRDLAFSFTQNGVQPGEGSSVYQWRSLDGAWTVSFGRRFLTLHTLQYEGFADFQRRLDDVLDVLAGVVGLQAVERIGVRYVNRISEPSLIQNIDSYMRPEVLGYNSLSAHSGDVEVLATSNQAFYRVGDAGLQIRSGVVPSGETPDPSLPPLSSPTWVLDIDAHFEGNFLFSKPEVDGKVGRLADIAYDFFKHVVTAGFVREFGRDE